MDGESEARCEWDLMQILHRKGCVNEIDQHRRTYIVKADFERIKNSGLNAVRLPFGYWTVLGPLHGDPYHGPALEFIDQAVQWAAECGLQVVLDLHGAPGGESGDAPCGRLQEPQGNWQWSHWRFNESLKALEVVSKRYSGCINVTGVEVCNEPSNSVPTSALCRFYSQAVSIIRKSGMNEDRVAVILPVFQRPKAKFAKEWKAITGGIHKNVAFDFHYYHCFGSSYDGRTLAQQFRVVERHAAELREMPAVVGEWSLALGRTAREGGHCATEIRAWFSRLQMEAYSHASHGWFFWNWKDGHGVEWDWHQSYEEGSMLGKAMALPQWDGHGDDPLEDMLQPSPPVRDIVAGSEIALRSYHGRRVAVSAEDENIGCDSDRACECFTICGHGLSIGSQIIDGSTVRLCTHDGRFLVVDVHNGKVDARLANGGGQVELQLMRISQLIKRALSDGVAQDDVDNAVDAENPKDALIKLIFEKEDLASVFIVHVEGGGHVQHRGAIYLQSLATFNMLHMDNGLQCLWDDQGEWQRFVIEKESVSATSQSKQLMTQHTVATTPERKIKSFSQCPYEQGYSTPEKVSDESDSSETLSMGSFESSKLSRSSLKRQSCITEFAIHYKPRISTRARARSRSRSRSATSRSSCSEVSDSSLVSCASA
jgi:glucan 1,3-beta-glucosidase